jgi:hypothetical protein
MPGVIRTMQKANREGFAIPEAKGKVVDKDFALRHS